ncbi:MAG: phosphatase [Methylophilaceae bacterium 17-44-8]|nr:MAG: phosphatase [Methylophilales bacterium 16-45-7]OZA06234.1 MAG: phosphatase [Methylophilaceae bacterium 17-44-8]
MKFTIYQSSRQGPRAYNQDRLAYSYSKDALLMVLADGMGGHRHGEVAAQLAVKTLTEAFQRLALPTLPSPAKFLTDHIQQIHDMIENKRQMDDLIESPRTTVVAAIIQRNTLYCAHVGDSRLYHFRDGHLLFRTEDHSIVQSMYRKGLISKEEMSTHPYRNKIYNCLGGDNIPQIDLADRHELQDGDIILLCTDGIWNVIDDREIKNILVSGVIDETIAHLLDTSEKNSDHTGDNMSAIGLQWGDRQHNPQAVSTITMPLDQTTTIMNPSTQPSKLLDAAPDDLTDDEIEKTIAEIQAALTRPKSF